MSRCLQAFLTHLKNIMDIMDIIFDIDPVIEDDGIRRLV
jgi:hypothetical protein